MAYHMEKYIKKDQVTYLMGSITMERKQKEKWLRIKELIQETSKIIRKMVMDNFSGKMVVLMLGSLLMISNMERVDFLMWIRT